MIAAPPRRMPEGRTGRHDEQQLAEHEARHLGPLAAPVGEVMEVGWHGRELRRQRGLVLHARDREEIPVGIMWWGVCMTRLAPRRRQGRVSLMDNRRGSAYPRPAGPVRPEWRARATRRRIVRFPPQSAARAP